MEKTLMELLAHAAHDLALNAEVLRLILNAETEDERPALLKTYLENLEKFESDETWNLPPWMNDAKEGWNLRCMWGSKIDDQLTLLVRKNLPETEFYCQLWQSINTNVECHGFDVGVVTLFRCTTLELLPYVYLDPAHMVEMKQDEFYEIMEALRPTAIHEMRCILNAKLDQRTKYASLMLDLLDRYEGKERIILMSAILMETNQRSTRLASLLERLEVID